jgi:hypothetical protein
MRVTTENNIDYDVFILVSEVLAMLDWGQNIDFVDCFAGEPE